MFVWENLRLKKYVRKTSYAKVRLEMFVRYNARYGITCVCKKKNRNDKSSSKQKFVSENFERKNYA